MDDKSRAWLEINLDNLLHNYSEIKRAARGAGVMAVVKANAYGHGSIAVSEALTKAGCDYLAVAAFNEAMELREAGIKTPVLVMSHISEPQITAAIKENITLTVFSVEMAEAVSQAADKLNKKARIHIKIDTGLTRLGVPAERAAGLINQVRKWPSLEIEGLFTHFASADETDAAYTHVQLKRFNDLLNQLDFTVPLIHAANSAAVIMHPSSHFNRVRPGIALYGCYPSGETGRNTVALKPCMRLKARIMRVQEIDSGVSVSYGRIFTADRPSVIAAVPVGYGDGYSRLLTGKARAAVKTGDGYAYAPVVGKICMDVCMLDVTGLGVRVGDEVTLFGCGISVEEIAGHMGTVNYEVMCMISGRVPRVYVKN